MIKVPVELIKELRAKTGAGMGDCRKALIEAENDMDQAIDYLRKSGLLKAAKKSSRTTKEGKIVACVKNGIGAMVEVLCETDFVAKNEKFIQFCAELVERVADEYSELGDLSELIKEREKGNVGDLVTTVGENIQLRRAVRLESDATLTSYLHLGGKIGVLVDVAGTDDEEYLKNLAMHIAAFNPIYLAPEDVPEEMVAREKEIYAAQPEMQGKPEQVLEKILNGRINKWYGEICLIKQAWIWEQKKRVEQMNPDAKIQRFVRWQVGEDL